VSWCTGGRRPCWTRARVGTHTPRQTPPAWPCLYGGTRGTPGGWCGVIVYGSTTLPDTAAGEVHFWHFGSVASTAARLRGELTRVAMQVEGITRAAVRGVAAGGHAVVGEEQ
jgi:hypothetical protein